MGFKGQPFHRQVKALNVKYLQHVDLFLLYEYMVIY